MFGLWIRFLKSIYFEYSQNSSQKKKKNIQKANNIINNPTPKRKRCKFSFEHLSPGVRSQCTHLSCVRSKNESECINFQCQNFRAFVALKSVSRIVISIFNKTRTTDRTMVGTRQNRVIIGP